MTVTETTWTNLTCGFGVPSRACGRMAVEVVAIHLIPDVWHLDDVRNGYLALCDKHRIGIG